MTPTQILVEEHKVILRVMDSIAKEADKLDKEGMADFDKIAKFVDFTRNFTDGIHHAKEEKRLFVKMAERGMSMEAGPIGVMMEEHNAGRQCIRNIADNIDAASGGDANASKKIVSSLRDFIYLLKNHIAKEDQILYPMADNMLSQADQKELEEAFEHVRTVEIGEAVHAKYYKLAEELTA
ncbi:MAG: uncharacterized protein HW421_4036 [Ignavibacteria bacterium]|nr:uncharacterized protein [Ignavibacteria bacterium]